MAANDFWNERQAKHVRNRTVAVAEEDTEASEAFFKDYLQGVSVNPRGVITHLIPSAHYATQLERDNFEKAKEEGLA